MIATGIHHVSVNVTDVERALEFYVGVLGLEPLPRPDLGIDGAWLALADGRQVHLIESTVPADLGQHFAVRVDDIDASIAELRGRGIRVSDPSPIGDAGALQAFCSDPDGNRVELHRPA